MDFSAPATEAISPEEKAYFDTRGEAALPAETPTEQPTAPVEPPAGDPPPADKTPEELLADDVKDGEAKRDEKGRFVPHGAFHEERERRKALEAELQETRERMARGDERLRLLSEAFKPAEPAPEDVPDPEKDIFGYARHLERQISDLKNGFQKSTEQTQAEREQGAILTAYRGDAERFIAQEPAFADAYNHLVQGRMEELKLYGLAENEIAATLAQDELQLVREALKAKQSPAERIFAMAKLRGFQPKAAEPTQPGDDAAARIDRTAAGLAAGKSLSGAGGAPAGELTIETLADMSEADFAALMAKDPQKVRRLMGG